jgi:hypothetical protein
MMRNSAQLSLVALAAAAAFTASCGNSTGLFNPAFVNTVEGGVFPLTPGPGSSFVLVRGLNETAAVLEFFITIERRQLVLDENGEIIRDGNGNPMTEDVLESSKITTLPGGRSNDVGVLYECSESAILRVGLGENLLASDAAVFVSDPAMFNFDDPLGNPGGYGILAQGLPPLRLVDGNFFCGDTVVFRAFASSGVPGGVRLQSFVLAGYQQPTSVTGPNTFVNYEAFLESQAREDE